MAKTFKEMRFHPNIGEHDLGFKVKQIRKFLQKQLQVKIAISMRGRENLHRDLAILLMNKLSQQTSDLGRMDPPADKARLNGNTYNSVISPFKLKEIQGQNDKQITA